MLLSAPKYFDATFPERLRNRVARWIVHHVVPPYLRLRQRFAPAYYSWVFGRWFVLGFDAVQEVFTRWEDAPVTNHHKTTELGWKPPFLLAVRDKDEMYDQVHDAVRRAWSPADRLGTFRAIARSAFETRLTKLGTGTHRFDAIGDYMIPGFLEIIDRYYGVKVPNPKAESDFVHALFVISSFFFGSPMGDRKTAEHAKDAFNEAMRALRGVVDDARANPRPRGGVLHDLITAGIGDDDLTSWLLGMILGFIPTSTNAQGRVLDVLLRRPEALAWANQTVASVGTSEDFFIAVCHEALRLNYILPGLFRQARNPMTLGEDTGTPFFIEEDALLLVSNQTAMFDPRRFQAPTRFDPTRAYLKYLNYGHRMHFCVAWDLSDIVMTETFRPLVLANLTRPQQARVEWRGAFPWVREVEITNENASVTP